MTTNEGEVLGSFGDIAGLETRVRARAVGASILAHVAVAVLLIVLPGSVPRPQKLGEALRLPRIVFLIEPGPGGGGGGGGSRSSRAATLAKVRGERSPRVAIQAKKTPEPRPIKVEESPSAAPEVIVAVADQANDDRNEGGALEGVEDPFGSRGPGEGAGAGSGSGSGIAPGVGPGIGPGWGGGFGGGAYRLGSGIEPPVLLRQVRPTFTTEAIRRKIEGAVLLEVVILSDGTVGDIRVMRSLDAGLDVKAIEAVRQWLFYPGKFKGQPVDVLAEVQVVFGLI